MKSIDRTSSKDQSLMKDRFEHFPTEILLPIFAQTDDVSLLNLALVSARFDPLVREIFAERYTNKYFLINGESERYRCMYTAQFELFGDSIRAIQANGIRHIGDDHWLFQLINKHTPNLEKLCFKKCLFKNIDNFLSQHINIKHLIFRDCACDKDTPVVQMPDFRNLRLLELFEFSGISKPSLEHVLQNNPQMERLILNDCNHYFTLPKIMELVQTHMKHLKELNILDSYEFASDRPSTYLQDQLITVLTSLDSFGMTVLDEWERRFLQSINSKCRNIKSLEIYNYRGYFKREMIETIKTFTQIETLSLVGFAYQEQIENIIENLPNIRCLSISRFIHRTNAQILTILRKCKRLEKLIIQSGNSSVQHIDDDLSVYRKNLQFQEDFIATIHNPHTRLEFIENNEVIGIVTKDEIIWRNKLLHWVNYEPIHSCSNLRLLDLATVPEGSNIKHKQPINLIFNYLDLNSLYSFGMANKETKQLVHSYIFNRCKQPSKKRAKHRTLEREKFYMTDEFGINFDGLRLFGKSIKYLEINMFDYLGAHELLNEIEKHCKLLTKLCFRTHYRIDPHRFILPQIRHFVFYGYGLNDEYVFYCDLSELSEKCPNLEILEIKTRANLYTGSSKMQKMSFQNLQKIKFKPYDDSQVKYAQELFKDTDTEIIIDH